MDQPILIGYTEHDADGLLPPTPQGIDHAVSDFFTMTIFHCPAAEQAK
jgi:hypothetical protein